MPREKVWDTHRLPWLVNKGNGVAIWSRAAEVNTLDQACRLKVEQEVPRLDISMYKIVRVHVLYGIDLRGTLARGSSNKSFASEISRQCRVDLKGQEKAPEYIGLPSGTSAR